MLASEYRKMMCFTKQSPLIKSWIHKENWAKIFEDRENAKQIIEEKLARSQLMVERFCGVSFACIVIWSLFFKHPVF